MTDDAVPADGTDGYRPKPPLWRPKRAAAPTNHWMDALLVAAAGGLVALSFGGERLLLSTPPLRVPVTVQRVDAMHQDDSAPPTYSYAVLLPDGTIASYLSPRLHRQGDRLTLLLSRGRLTGRNLMSGPALMLENGVGPR
jgi:hypothetical protein